MTEVTLQVVVTCDECGADISNLVRKEAPHRYGKVSFRIAPCSRCIDGAHRNGYDEGYGAGHDSGFAIGCKAAADGGPVSGGRRDE